MTGGALDEREEERFQATIKTSNAATFAVISWLWRNSSWWIKTKPAVARATGSDPAGENTIADIFISHNGNDWQRIEVKHRNLHFASAEDFRYPTLFLDRIKPVPPANWYFIVNANRTHAAVVPAEVPRNKTFINDRGKAGDTYEAWECDKAHPKIRWVAL